MTSDLPPSDLDFQDRQGVTEIDNGVFVDVMVPRGKKKHRHFRGSLPESKGIEQGFSTAPMMAVYSDSAHVDVRAGLTLAGGRPVAATAVVPKLTEQYGVIPQSELATAREIDPERIVLPVASQRYANYCRWWLDSVAKVFVCGQSSFLRRQLRDASYTPTVPILERSFQWQTMQALGGVIRSRQESTPRFLRCRSINSPGLTFGGGQRLGAWVADFARFLDFAIPSPDLRSPSGGEFLYLSRNDSPMRRIVNEDDLLPKLTKLGFQVISPAALSIPQQIEAFRRARIVVGAHGAGLTNVLFCKPDTVIVEIFPEGGVHGSAFHRISSFLELPYFFVVGERVETRQGAKNPNNNDIRLSVDDVTAFLGRILRKHV